MRILMITQWFQPEPTLKGLSLAAELTRRGHEVEVLTGFPNYPGGEVYPGYRIRPWRREQVEGVRVTRVALYPSHDASAVRRIINYASFAVSATLAVLVLVRRPDVAYVYHPPATVGLPAVVLRKLRRVPFVYDIQDLWPDTLTATGMVEPGWMLRAIGRWMRYVYRQAAHILVLSPGFKRTLEDRGVDPDDISILYNWTEEPSPYDPTGIAETLKMPGRFNVVFAGNMGRAQALETVIDAAALVAHQDPTVQFLLIGDGLEVEALKHHASATSAANVRFVDRIERAAVDEVFASAEALLVHLKDDPLFTITIPSKTQAYLAAGRPIIVAVRGDAATLVEQAGAGVTCQPEDPEDLAAAVLSLSSMSATERAALGEAGARFYQEQLSFTIGADLLEDRLRAHARR